MTAAEKREAIRLVEESDVSARQTLREIQIPRATFYRWYRRYREDGTDGLQARPPAARRYWNRIPLAIRQRIVNLALAAPERTPRELRVAIHRPGRPFPVGVECLSDPASVRPDHEPGLCGDDRREDVSAADAPVERAVANRLHVSPRRAVGLVLPLDRPRRLLALHPRLDGSGRR